MNENRATAPIWGTDQMSRLSSGRAALRATCSFFPFFIIGLAQPALATTPANGTLSLTSLEVTFTSGAHAASNPSNRRRSG